MKEETQALVDEVFEHHNFMKLFKSDAIDSTDREILTLRFGLKKGIKPQSLETVGKIFAKYGRPITRERVRQLQNIALSKLRRALDPLDDELEVEP